MRLDIFLPFLRKSKPGNAPSRTSLPVRMAQRFLPASWFSNPGTAKPGAVRRWLRRIGPTWLSSPVRRGVQSACFVLFFVLFLYVCYPYDARPARQWRCAAPTIDDQERWTFVVNSAPTSFSIGKTIYATRSTHDGSLESSIAATVVTVSADACTVGPLRDLDPTIVESVRFDPGEVWVLSEVPLDAWPAHYSASLASKEWLPAESLLVIDPLVSLSTAIAARHWIWSLVCAAAILAAALFVPRGFCGWICPLGTAIDLFDSTLGRRFARLRVADDGWWVHIKYYVLAGTLVAAACGVLVSGYVAAIPVITRGSLFLFGPLQTAYARGWHNVPPWHAGHVVSLILLALVFGVGVLKPRFWCKYVCPSGAVFSIGNLFRLTERKVEDSCIHCNKCIEICPFDAIKADYTTRVTDCTFCQSCGGVCPTQAIKFVERSNFVSLKLSNDPPTHETALGRRGFMSLAAGSAAALVSGLGLSATHRRSDVEAGDEAGPLPIRPPGSLPEVEFLAACIRCGECFKACPNDVLQPLGFQEGLAGLWTPAVNANLAGCESSCNACGQVCPTGAIRALPLEEKRHARIGLAIIDTSTCLPYALREACQLCVDECTSAGYQAIEFTRVGTQIDSEGNPLEESGFLAPVVQADRCVGCGLCQTRCYAINYSTKGLLAESAVVIHTGQGREDRIFEGSYRALREAEAEKQRANRASSTKSDDYLPDFLK